MKIIFTTFIILLSMKMTAQTYNTIIEKANVVNIKKGTQTINIKEGNFNIGQIILNGQPEKAKLFLDTMYQFKDTFKLWHMVIKFKSPDPNPSFPSYFTLKFSSPIINVILNIGGLVHSGLDSSKKIYSFSSGDVCCKNPFTIIINSETKQRVELYGILPKQN